MSMQINDRWTTLGWWLLASCLAAGSSLLLIPAAHIGDDYFPIGHDSFYHAVRILQTARDPASFFEFDPNIHAPEGSLLTWPWGYDYFMAMIVRAGMAVGLSSDPLTIMSWIPVCASFIGVALLMLVARLMGLRDWPVALAALCLALNQTTQLLYGYGQIDHHYAEHIFILGSLAAGLAWFRSPGVGLSVLLGSIFGLALAIHNGLFIIQVPFLATLVVRWLQGERVPFKSAAALAAASLLSAIAVLIPSQPFQMGRFEFYTLSWFHLYIVSSSAVVVMLLAWLQPGRRSIAAVVAIGAALLVPLVKQIQYAQSFVSGSLGMLNEILEMRPPGKLALEGEFTMLSGTYSCLIYLAPFSLLLCVFKAWRERHSSRLLFWIYSVLGLVLLSTQLRMHYFGSFAMYLPWLIVVQEYAMQRQELYRRTMLVASLLLVLAYVPVIRWALVAPVPPAGDQWFRNLYAIFPAMREACEKDPGIVLADSNAGHYIRYFTGCPVIVNNFLLTEQHFQKVDEAKRLLNLPADQFVKQAPPYVKYVLIRAADIDLKADGEYSYSFFGDVSRLSQDLLLAPRASIPPEFKHIFEVNIEVRIKRAERIPYAVLYQVEHSAAPDTSTPTTTSASDASG